MIHMSPRIRVGRRKVTYSAVVYLLKNKYIMSGWAWRLTFHKAYTTSDVDASCPSSDVDVEYPFLTLRSIAFSETLQ